MTLTEQVRQAARDAGFDAVGVSRVDECDQSETIRARLMDWLGRGFHATMGWMGRDPERRADPRRVLNGCRSVISVALNYYTEHRADERYGHGRIARYAWGDDYHTVFGERLTALQTRLESILPGHRFLAYADTGPVMEKAWAQAGGLGWIGKHSNLVSTQFGSWLLLGELLTTAPLAPDAPGTDLCGTCALCIRACPTGAISEPYVVDAGRCISYVTIELRGEGHEIAPHLAGQMGNRIFGCDDCLDACPYNMAATPTAAPAFQPRPLSLAPRLEDLARIDARDFNRLFHRSPIRRPKLGGFLRSVRIALANLARTASSRPEARLTG